LSQGEEKKILFRMLKDVIEKEDKNLPSYKIIEKYQKELLQLTKYDNNTKDVFGSVNT